jgi:hypothetical protein
MLLGLTCLAGRQKAASRLLATVAGSVGSVLAVAILLYMYWRFEMAPVSRRLIGSKRGEAANQKDLPYELRKKYEAVTVLGSGANGVVIAAWQLCDRKRTICRAIKVVHARHRKFEEKDLRRLNREVILELSTDFSTDLYFSLTYDYANSGFPSQSLLVSIKL